MLELAKLIHAAVGTDKTWVVVSVLALVGAVLFGLLGWAVNAAYITTLPKFNIQMQTANLATPSAPFDAQKDSLIVLVVSVSNSSGPSVAKDWNLYVKIGDGQFIKAKPAPMGDTLILAGADINSNKTYHQKDALYLITASKPIQIGDSPTGVLPFVLVGVTKQQLLEKSTTFKLTVFDVFEREHSAIKTTGDFIKESGIHFPVISEH
jgi:hypothetical protein